MFEPVWFRLVRLRLKEWRSKACNLVRVIPEIDIWRAANLMLKRYGEKALEGLRRAPRVSTRLRPTAITTARQCGAASPTP